MKTKSTMLFACVAAAMALLGRVQSADPSPPSDFSIVQPPESQTVASGTFVAFAVRASQELDATYQWRVTTVTNQTNVVVVNIPNETNRYLIFPSATEEQVAAYSVVVKWKNVTNLVTSPNVFLRVFEVHGTNSAYGGLVASVLEFGSPSGDNVCADYPTLTFDKRYLPATSTGALYSFYGPGVAVAHQTGAFVNSLRNRFLKVDTVSVTNAPSPTMVRLSKNFYNPVDTNALDCEAGNSVNLPIMEYYEMATVSDVSKARYKVAVYYRSPGPSSGKVVMHWLYFD